MNLLSPLRYLVPAATLALAFGCAAEATGEDLDDSSSEVRRQTQCAEEIDVSMERLATVTADNSGVKCYDDSGAYVASIIGSLNGVAHQVRVFQGQKKTFSGKKGNFVKVRGITRTSESEECWMSADYLCVAKTTDGKESAGWDQAALDGEAKGKACALTSTTCCAQLTGTAKTSCDAAFKKRKDEAAAAERTKQQDAAKERAAKETGTQCWFDADYAVTWEGVAEGARTCCEEKLATNVERGVCLARVEACKEKSFPNDLTRECP